MPARPNYARRRTVALGALLVAVVAVIALTRGGGDTGGGPTAAARAAEAAASPARLPLTRAVGQTLAGVYPGRTPPAAFLARIRRGELGSVILFAPNVAGGPAATRRAVARLQAAAKAGGNAPLLVMTDQEGGAVKRLAGPPSRAPAAMRSVAVARAEGAATGRLLHGLGITLDLAPVADVKRVHGSFLGTRAFGSDPAVVAQRACAFAAGLRGAGVAAALKHFPGLGRAGANTDLERVRIDAPAAALRSDYAPYARCAKEDRTLVMLSNATYPRLLAGDAPAVLDPATYAKELPAAGVPTTTPTISDDLDANAIAGRDRPALRALRAGLDLLLFARSSASSATAHTTLVADVRTGTLPEARVRDAAAAVLALKASLDR
ncbi:hypothetical protein NBH00_19620 [Paraconexibacter antarcticus]|uniref:Glycoside hydrolase family 3 N-terminal domain-containing protein n=1 Tax=Paraconexibacter antarcticus TaxID=2949664 RepID=A0ABY5DRK1_9ACTN|nr:glycoside hydrolase family 3 N-terminal domain-containing protein [Paraconexibacter antarcticus]UTI63539.1 hypothetical protein NBH00_19620 [Paraconexibacter antarcticus]